MGVCISKKKAPPPVHRMYNIHGIQYLPENKDETKNPQEVTANGVQGKLLREQSSVNGFSDIQWLDAEYPFENVIMSGGGSKGYAYIGALKVGTVIVILLLL